MIPTFDRIEYTPETDGWVVWVGDAFAWISGAGKPVALFEPWEAEVFGIGPHGEDLNEHEPGGRDVPDPVRRN